MAKTPRVLPWLLRLILLPPIIVYALMAYGYLLHPVEKVAAVGIIAGSPLAVTTLRIFFGSFPLGCLVILVFCLVSKGRLLMGLGISATLTGVILAVRVAGMLADGTTQRNLPAAATEAIVLVLTLIGIFAESRRRAQEKIAV